MKVFPVAPDQAGREVIRLLLLGYGVEIRSITTMAWVIRVAERRRLEVMA